MRIVIAGAGEVGSHLAKMLSLENHEIVMIDSDDDRLKNLAATNDLLTLQGDVTSKKFLIEAGVGKANLFIAVTPSDDTNIVSAIMAKNLGAKLTVVRISDEETINRETHDTFASLGIDSVVYPEKMAAHEVTNTLRQSGVSTFVDFSGGKLSMLAVRINKYAPIVYKTLKEAAGIIGIEYRAVVIMRDSQTILPYGNERYEPDDIVHIVINPYNIKNIMRYFGQKQEQISQVIILGGSHIGRLIAKDLGKDYHIKLFEANRDEAYRLSDTLNNTLVIHGDGTKVDLLLEEGLKNTDAFIAVTGKSETNILACLLAKNEGVKHTVAEIENLDYINLAERLGIDTIINKKLIAAGHIYRFTLSRSVTMMKYLATANAKVFEFVVSQKSKIIQKPVCEINFPKNAIIGGLIRGKAGYVATGDTWIQPGDHVVVFAMPFAFGEVSRFFQ
ncbi:MAG: Trk system potassium transporter TrkA [Tannerella sp.]|jgi:trk system potassium uptake protein TrkA|nr:Trk system potassium transporter TrkA [Tannerella sp.]